MRLFRSLATVQPPRRVHLSFGLVLSDGFELDLFGWHVPLSLLNRFAYDAADLPHAWRVEYMDGTLFVWCESDVRYFESPWIVRNRA